MVTHPSFPTSHLLRTRRVISRVLCLRHPSEAEALSLSVVLRHYLPLAGQVTWDPRDRKPSIVVSVNDAVSLTVAEIESDFSLLSSNGRKRPEAELRPLVPELQSSDDSASVCSLQITMFPNQGFCIGVAGHHAVFDGKTASMFIRSWAHVCKQIHQERDDDRAFPSLPEDLTPCLDRSLIKDPAGGLLDAKMLELVSCFKADKNSMTLPPTREVGPDVVRVTLELTREDIEKLRERVKNESSSALQGLHLSTFVVACAYVWSCVVRARGGDACRPVAFLIVADFRHRLNPPVPATYFGNCLFPVGRYDQTARAFSEEKSGFVKAVEIFSEMVKGLGSRRVDEIYEAFAEGFRCDKPGTQFGSVAGSNRLGIYRSDFGWGKPVKIEILSINQSEAFSVAERRDEAGGVEMGLCLGTREMDVVISLFNNGLK